MSILEDEIGLYVHDNILGVAYTNVINHTQTIVVAYLSWTLFHTYRGKNPGARLGDYQTNIYCYRQIHYIVIVVTDYIIV